MESFPEPGEIVTFPREGIEIYEEFLVDYKFKVSGYVQLVFLVRYVSKEGC